jgi:hypothetical protein
MAKPTSIQTYIKVKKALDAVIVQKKNLLLLGEMGVKRKVIEKVENMDHDHDRGQAYETKEFGDVDTTDTKDGDHRILDFTKNCHYIGGCQTNAEGVTLAIKVKELEDSWQKLAKGSCWAVTTSVSGKDLSGIVEYNGKPLPESKDELLAISTFGDLKTCETKIDLEVRDAYEILPSAKGTRLRVNEKTINFLDQIKDRLSHLMYNGKDIEFVLNKVNIYFKGGKFTEHKDTPRQGVLGTLILQLPTSFKGGDMFIRSSNSHPFDEVACKKLGCYRYDGSTVDRDSLTDELAVVSCGHNYVKVAAFHYESPHRIDKVIDGQRITVSFYIMDASSPTAQLAREGKDADAKSSNNYSSLVLKPYCSSNLVPDAAADKKGIKELATKIRQFDSEIGPVGVLLRHQYSNHDIKHCNFRGVDKLLYDRCLVEAKSDGKGTKGTAAKAVVTVEPAIIVYSKKEYSADDVGDSCQDIVEETKVYRLTDKDIEALAEGRKDEASIAVSKDKKWIEDFEVTFIGRGLWDTLRSNKSEGDEANPHTIDNIYSMVALIYHDITPKEPTTRSAKRAKVVECKV